MSNQREYVLSVQNPDVKASVTTLSSAGGIEVCRIHVIFPENTLPSPVTVRCILR